TGFGEMSGVGGVRKFKAQVFHAGFRDGRLETADLRVPLKVDVKTQRAIEVDLAAVNLRDAADERRVRAAVQVFCVAGITGVKRGGQRVVGIVRLENFNALTGVKF